MAFLVCQGRGKFAWFGYGFAGCDFPVAPEFLEAGLGKGPLGELRGLGARHDYKTIRLYRDGK